MTKNKAKQYTEFFTRLQLRDFDQLQLRKLNLDLPTLKRKKNVITLSFVGLLFYDNIF